TARPFERAPPGTASRASLPGRRGGGGGDDEVGAVCVAVDGEPAVVRAERGNRERRAGGDRTVRRNVDRTDRADDQLRRGTATHDDRLLEPADRQIAGVLD